MAGGKRGKQPGARNGRRRSAAAEGPPGNRRRRPLKDQAARDRAAADLDTSYIVEAAAGTGKTTLLVSRILSLIRERKAVPDEIVAITFTERAAAELKTRLRDDLSKALQGAEPDSPASRHLADALWGLERMQVTTIHSFCAALLRERPVEAGVDPNFEVADELMASLVEDEAWDEWLARRMRRADGAMRAALAIGITLGNMRELAGKMLENRDVLRYLPKPQPWTLEDHEFPRRFEAAVASMSARADAACRNTEDKAAAVIEDLKAKAEELRFLKTPEEMAAHLFRLTIPSLGSKGRQADWQPAQCLKDIRTEMAELRDLHDAFRNWLAHNIIAEVAEDLLGFVDTYRARMAAAAMLDFHDLLLLARNMLKEHPHVRAYFRKRYGYLLVDEFQDTDPLQAEIVFFLAEADGPPAAEWEKVKVDPGRLFLVGDPKQSIYRFRRADIEMYNSAKRSMGTGRDLSIFQNFRCAHSLVGVVNEIFRDLIDVPPDGAYQPAYVALEFGRDPEEVPPVHGVQLIYPPESLRDRMPNAGERRRLETRAIAAFVRKLVDEHGWEIWDKNEKRRRRVALRDIAVLLRTHTPVDLLEEAFKAYGVDYRVIGGKFFFTRPEVRELLAVLQAIDNPYDGIALVAALRSPFFGVSDEDIFTFHADGGRLNYLEGAGDAVGTPLEHAFGLLRDLNGRRNDVAAEDLLREIYGATKATAVFLLRPGGEQHVHNLMKVADIARALSERGVLTFRSFVEWLGERGEEEADEAEAATVEAGDDFVRVLTVHKAKGLEFPVVILADLASGKREREPFIIDRRKEEIAILTGARNNGIRTLGYDEARLYEGKRLEAEEKRLLYVAMTRARDLLVIPAYWATPRELDGETGRPREGRLLHFLADKIPPPDDLVAADLVQGMALYDTRGLDFEPGEPHVLRVTPRGAPKTSRAVEKQAAEHRRATADLARSTARGRPLTTATEAVGREEEKTGKTGEGEAGRGGDGARFGKLVHGLLEVVDWERPEGLDLIARTEAESLDLGAGAGPEASGIVRRALAGDLMRRIVKSDAFYREVPFVVREGAVLLEGKMDVVFREGNDIYVVDFKTDRVTGGDIETRAEHYRPQAEAYARAIEAACGTPPREVIFLFLHPMQTVHVRPA